MKARILFLDDEPLALQGLQRMLRSMRAEWDMTFVASGPQALDEMARSPCDIVVSDMLMPGMNGAQFLSEVRARHPECARLILSGHADRELICQGLMSAHQALSKPCQPEVLKATVTRVLDLRLILPHPSLRLAVARMNCVPSSPDVFRTLTEALGRPDVSVDDVAPLVLRDVGISAKLLQLVNSGFFGIRKPIVNTAEAVYYLGLDTIKTLVLIPEVLAPFPNSGAENALFSELWKHSLQTAIGAELLALHENLDRSSADEAFAAGLLHDVGKFVLVSHFPEPYTEAVQLAKAQNLELRAAEAKVLGASHGEVGAYLLGLWGLPPSVIEAARWHHTPHSSPNRTFDPLLAVHAANALVAELFGSHHGSPPSTVDLAHLASLGWADRLEPWRQALKERFSLSAEP